MSPSCSSSRATGSDAAMLAIRDLPHVLAVINAATIIVLLRAYSLIRARDRAGHRRTMLVAIALGVAFLTVYFVYHAFAGLAKFGGHGAIRPVYFTLLAVHVFMAFAVAVLVPLTFFNALKERFGTHRRLARVTLPMWLFVAASGLVVHVVFSLVIWLQGIFAFLVSVATLQLSGEDMRAAPLGRIGQGAILVAFPCLFAPAFIDATQPELTNYIPLIRHPAYDFGLMALALGVLAPVVRLLVNLPGRLAVPPLAIAMALAGIIYILALACFGIAGMLLAR